MSSNGVQLRVRGKVQGVGFRPFVWQLAHQLQLTAMSAMTVRACWCALRVMGDFTARLRQDCPPLARIDASTRSRSSGGAAGGFTIRHSAGGAMDTQIVPDAATCPACLAEMRDPRERRYRYPFINCTHCGPRFTIIRAMPYDRPATAMAHFRSAAVKWSIATPPTGAFTLSRSPARTAGHSWNGVRVMLSHASRHSARRLRC
jgi:hydrogenase maturation protein HypF